MTRDRAISGASALLFFAVYAVIALRRFAQGEAASWDNAIFEEAVRGYSQWGAPIVNVKGPGFNLLGDHFSPILALLGPVYAVFPDGRTLLLVQVALIALSIFIVAALALRHLAGWAAAVVVAGYGLSFGFQSAVVSEFHEVAFAVPLLALAGAAFIEERPAAVMGWVLPLLLVKEDLGITVAAAGAALFVAGWRRRGVILALVGLCATAATVFLVIPAFRNGTGYAYGLGGSGVLDNLAADPGRKALTVVLTLCVGGAVAVLSPWILLVLPTFAWRFTADNPFYWGTGYHYALVLMPIVAIAGIGAMRRHPRLVLPAGVVIVVATACLFPASPVRQYLEPSAWRPTPRELAAHAVLKTVPYGVRVDADVGLMNQLVTGRDVTFLGSPGNAVPDWVVIDHVLTPGFPTTADWATQRYGVRFRPVLSTGPFDVAKRVRDGRAG